MAATLWRWSYRAKSCPGTKSKVSEVKNSRYIFTLISPHLIGSENLLVYWPQALILSIDFIEMV